MRDRCRVAFASGRTSARKRRAGARRVQRTSTSVKLVTKRAYPRVSRSGTLRDSCSMGSWRLHMRLHSLQSRPW
jgi:hypothetical protein